MQDRIDLLQAMVDKKEQSLFDQFVKLETAMADFQAQENYLTEMITQLNMIASYRAKNG